VTVRWALRKATGEKIKQEEQQLIVPALTSVWLESVTLPDMDERNSYISYECLEKGVVCSSGTVLLTLPKYFRFENPELTYTVAGDVITVSASAYAKSVQISNENDDLILEDNFFDLNGDSRSIKILQGKAEGIKLCSVYDIGRR
jgi:beta-mannosidase